jgi:hypothetical protein
MRAFAVVPLQPPRHDSNGVVAALESVQPHSCFRVRKKRSIIPFCSGL